MISHKLPGILFHEQRKPKQSSLGMCRFVHGWQNDACKEKNITPAVKLVEVPPCCDAALLPLLLEAQNVRKEVNQMIAQAFYNECAISCQKIKFEMKMLGFSTHGALQHHKEEERKTKR